jgi:hypothetical protein
MNPAIHNAIINFIWGIADPLHTLEQETEGLLEQIVGEEKR